MAILSAIYIDSFLIPDPQNASRYFGICSYHGMSCILALVNKSNFTFAQSCVVRGGH